MKDPKRISLQDLILGKLFYEDLSKLKMDEISTRNEFNLKWYSPETIKSFKLNEKTEVWSFGILIWEAVSYGEIPYKEISSSSALIKKINEGFRLSQPTNCPYSIYQIISKCWKIQPDDRLSFSDLVEKIRLAINDLYHVNML